MPMCGWSPWEPTIASRLRGSHSEYGHSGASWRPRGFPCDSSRWLEGLSARSLCPWALVGAGAPAAACRAAKPGGFTTFAAGTPDALGFAVLGRSGRVTAAFGFGCSLGCTIRTLAGGLGPERLLDTPSLGVSVGCAARLPAELGLFCGSGIATGAGFLCVGNVAHKRLPGSNERELEEEPEAVPSRTVPRGEMGGDRPADTPTQPADAGAEVIPEGGRTFGRAGWALLGTTPRGVTTAAGRFRGGVGIVRLVRVGTSRLVRPLLASAELDLASLRCLESDSVVGGRPVPPSADLTEPPGEALLLSLSRPPAGRSIAVRRGARSESGELVGVPSGGEG